MSNNLSLMEQVITKGDLSQLSPQDRVLYYKAVCESVGLNPLTKPFEFMVLQGKTTLYARKDATEQLRKLHGISITIVSREVVNDIYVVTARATDKHGRSDESIGAVSIGNLKGDAAANAIMKAETKAKRRVTLSIGGLGLLDEHETETIKDARTVNFDIDTGEIIDQSSKPIPELSKELKTALDDLKELFDNNDMLHGYELLMNLNKDEKREISKHCSSELTEWLKKISKNPPKPMDIPGSEYARV